MKKIAVVTGAARGLGLAMCQRLLDDGLWVEGWDLKPGTFEHERFRFRAVDITNETSVKTASDSLAGDWGVPHVLINNAGITLDRMIHKMSTADFEATWNVNTKGAFLVTQALGIKMRDRASEVIKAGGKAPFCRIVMISSVAGVYGNVGQINYSASKAAVIGMAKSISKEWGRYRISSVAIAPGFMNTEMTKTIPNEIKNDFIKRTPLGRMGEASELAGLMSYLARDESEFLTGESICFAGGLLF